MKWSVGAVLLLMLWVLGVAFNFLGASAVSAEARLQSAVAAAVGAVAGEGVEVAMDGQRAIIVGSVDSQSQIPRIEAAAREAQSALGRGNGGIFWGGVTEVDFSRLSVREPRTDPFTWYARLDETQIELDGDTPSELDRTLLVAHARKVAGAERSVVDNMRVGPGAPHQQWTYLATVGLSALDHLESGRVEVRGHSIGLVGQALGEMAEQETLAALGVANNLVIGDDIVVDTSAKITVLTPPQSEPTPSPTPIATPTPIPTPSPTNSQPTESEPVEVIEPDPDAVQAAFCQVRFDTALEEQPIEFELGSAVIRQESYVLLNTLAAVAQKCPNSRLKIDGHTDSTGSAARNEQLSLQRADAVRTYLARRGVDSARMETEGHGPSQPRASNATEEGRARNRRIEITAAF